MIEIRCYSPVISLLIPGLLIFMIACSSSATEEFVTPPGLDGNEMYGQADMQWVLDNIAVFRSRTDLISPDREAARFLEDLREPVTIMVYMGSWNVDAQIHVPALFSTMRQVDNKRVTLKIIGMNRRLQDRDGLAVRYDITASPTFVVLHRDIEIGRIIESPTKNAAVDIVTILRTALGG